MLLSVQKLPWNETGHRWHPNKRQQAQQRNEFAAHLHGFESTPCCHLTQRIEKGHPFRSPLIYLSKSEQFRFGLAFQIALAMVTGLQFVVIDRADVLDKEKRRMLTSLLLNSKLEQAIVLATNEEPAPPHAVRGVKFLNLVERPKRGEVFAPTAA